MAPPQYQLSQCCKGYGGMEDRRRPSVHNPLRPTGHNGTPQYQLSLGCKGYGVMEDQQTYQTATPPTVQSPSPPTALPVG